MYANAAVMARALVHDETRILRIERGVGSDIGAWATPGGHVDAGSDAADYGTGGT